MTIIFPDHSFNESSLFKDDITISVNTTETTPDHLEDHEDVIYPPNLQTCFLMFVRVDRGRKTTGHFSQQLNTQLFMYDI